MKQLLVVLSFLLFHNYFSFSQSFKGGLSLGVTGSQIDGDSYSGYTKPGASAGFFVSRNLGRNWGMQGEFKYIMKGAAKRVTEASPDIYRVTLHYFEIPFTGYFNLNQRVICEAGLATAFLLHASINIGNGPEPPGMPYNKVDISALAGLYYILNEHFSTNLKFTYSVLPISNSPGKNIYNSNPFNNVINFSVYYTIK